MPIVSICPRDQRVANLLMEEIPTLRPAIRVIINKIGNVPLHDIIVNLKNPDNLNYDAFGACIVVYIETTPDKNLESCANDIRDAIIKLFIDRGFAGSGKSVEVWMRFIPGSWCIAGDGQVQDKVDHTA